MGAGYVRIVTDASFARDVLGSPRPTLVAFSALDCGPCRLMGPGLRALAAAEKERLGVARLYVEDNPATVDRYEVDSFPTCILFRDGEPVKRLDGYMPLRKVEAALAPHLEKA